MSLIVNLQVTDTPSRLVQIHNLIITNMGGGESADSGWSDTPYKAALDGVELGHLVYHDRDEGALALLALVLNAFQQENNDDN